MHLKKHLVGKKQNNFVTGVSKWQTQMQIKKIKKVDIKRSLIKGETIMGTWHEHEKTYLTNDKP